MDWKRETTFHYNLIPHLEKTPESFIRIHFILHCAAIGMLAVELSRAVIFY